MNKNDLVDAVAERTGLAKSDAARAVEAVLGTVTDALKKNETVALSGFGSFVTKTRAARTGGASLLLDTHALLAAIAETDPELHESLHRTERHIPFVFGAVTGRDGRLAGRSDLRQRGPGAPRGRVARAERSASSNPRCGPR